jgi:Protein of unknown function (DUF3106)
MKKFIVSVFTLAIIACLPSNTHAQTDSAKGKKMNHLHNKFKNMTPEEREAAKGKAREKWNNMTPEQKEAAKTKAKEKWNSLTPEQQEAAKTKAKEKLANATPEQKQAIKGRVGGRRRNG